MGLVVAGTDVLVDYLRGEGDGASRVADEIEAGLATTVVTAFELWAGALGSARRERAVAALLGAIEILPMEAADALRAAAVRRDLERSGLAIGMADSMIAGICLRRRVALFTRNGDHFGRVEGLMLLP